MQTYVNYAKNDFMGNLEDNARQKRELDRIESRFKKKPYYTDYKQMYVLATWSKYLFNTLSVLAGFYLVFSITFKATGIEALSYALAGTLLVLLEITKNYLLPKILLAWYAFRELKAFSMLLNIALISGSVFISVKGIENYSQEQKAVKPVLVNIRDMKDGYDKKIAVVQSERAKFIESVSYQGKINIYNKSTSEALANFDNQIKALQTEKDKATLKAEHENQGSKLAANSKTEAQTLYLVGLAGLNESLLILCLWYGVYFMHRVNNQRELVLDMAHNKTLLIDKNDFNLIFDIVRSFGNQGGIEHLQKSLAFPSAPSSQGDGKEIGFKPNGGGQDRLAQKLLEKIEALESQIGKMRNSAGDNRATTPNKQAYDLEKLLKKHRDIVAELEANNTNISDISRKTGKHRDTVKKVYDAYHA